MENNLDKYFRDNLHDRKFELKDEYWLGAEKLLDAQDKRRKRRGIFWWLFSGMIALSLVAGLFFWNNARPNRHVTENAVAIAAQQGKNDTVALLEKKAAKPGNDVQMNQNDSLNENDKSAKAEASNQKYITASGDNKTTTINLPKRKNRSRQSAGNQQVANQETGSSNFSKNSDFNDINQVESLKSGANNTVKDPLSIEPETEPESQQKDAGSAIANTNENSVTHIITPDYLAILRLFVKGNFEKQNLSTTVQKIEVANTAKWQINLFAAQLGQAAPDKGEKLFLAQRFGFLLRRNLHGGWYMASGLAYQHRVGSFDATQSTFQRNYRFGLELDSLSLRPSSLHYVSLPFMLGYERNKSRFEAGLFLDLLTGVRGETGSYQKQRDPLVKRFKAEESGWVTMVGYRQLVPTAQLGYHYQLARRWAIGITANYMVGGILDKNHEWPMGSFRMKETNKLNLGIQLNYRIK